MKQFTLAIVAILLSAASSFAQNIEKDWQLEASQSKLELININLSNKDVLSIKKGTFSYNKSSGDYIHQNNVLVFYYDTPADLVKRFKVQKLTDSTLVLKSKENIYAFNVKEKLADQTLVSETEKIIPSSGFTFTRCRYY